MIYITVTDISDIFFPDEFLSEFSQPSTSFLIADIFFISAFIDYYAEADD